MKGSSMHRNPDPILLRIKRYFYQNINKCQGDQSKFMNKTLDIRCSQQTIKEC